eukprot:CAMPEP_0196824654 /NCGR_PEP_ID=MMETSP1362-20130617/92608_1 /TAXON_ID=163516 /ORGANISM="Leptocylindrus danicus, Strain CCMP1856" /LENGTH=245 /DNA_ID=CAMNT_0042204977 /DNA_START=158 /DNA_END=895 /DNA_ORIENTATION=-
MPIDVDECHLITQNEDEGDSSTTQDMMQMVQTIQKLQLELQQSKLQTQELQNAILEECSCPICLEPMTNAIMLSCSSGHIVCRACEGKLFRIANLNLAHATDPNSNQQQHIRSLCPICRGGVSHVKSRRVAVLNNVVSKISTCTCPPGDDHNADDNQSYTTVDAIICPPANMTMTAMNSSTTTRSRLNFFVNEAERLIAGARRSRPQHQPREGSNSRMMNVIVEDRTNMNMNMNGRSYDDAIFVD